MAAVNYDAIAQELKRGLVANETTAACLGIDKPMVLKELYTLAFGGPRQTGKTKWMIESLIRDPDSRLVALNLTMREAIIKQLSAYASLDENRENGEPRPDAIWHAGGDGWIPVHKETADLIRKDPRVVEQAMCRIITAPMLRTMINQNNTPPIDISQIFIDQRVQAFHLIRASKYYTWLAKVSDKHILTWLID